MTDEAPPILATADLSPVSPSPLHPSSPVVVPILQEQADHVDAMTPLQTVEAFPVLIQQSYEQVRPSASVDAQETIRATTSDIPPGDNNTTAGSETAEPVGEESDHKHAAQIQRSDQSTDSEQDQQEVVTSETNRVMPIADSQHLVDNAADVANAGPNVQGAATLAADGESATSQAAMDNTGPEDFNKQTVPTSERKATESPSGKPELEAVNISQTAKQSSMAIVPGLQGGAGISTASKPSSLPARPPVSVDTLPQVPQSLLTASPSTRGPLSESLAQLHGAQNRLEQGPYGWETFQLEERKYVADAKWDRFPDGSRLFIGNLSSERVSKREVFDVFSRFGRLAQISLKQAFGFVQYHTQQEGQAAMDNLQGTEIKGRKINLEFSRTQKRNDDGDRRGSRGKGDRRDGADTAKPRRDDYHPGREPSPHRRGSHRSHVSYPEPPRFDDGRYGSRGRSRSPGYGSHDLGSYRRRSPSPRRPHEAGPTLDIPRRYGSEVPDVQFLLLQEVEPNFVSWVQRAFADISLRIDVMFLNPQYPRDAVIQRQVLEGVHAVAELDFRAQQLGRIALQVFDRSAGRDQVRFDQYQDLEPHVAAQLVARARAQTAQYPAAYGGGHYPPAPQYSQPGPPTQPLHAYVGQQYPYQGPSTQPYGTVAPPPTHGPLDNASLQQILGTIQIQQGGPGQANGGHVDVNALLATLGNNASGPQGQHSQQHYAHPGHAGVAQPPHGGDSAQHVQNIMSQLARYRQ